jgi:hypothetical protein
VDARDESVTPLVTVVREDVVDPLKERVEVVLELEIKEVVDKLEVVVEVDTIVDVKLVVDDPVVPELGVKAVDVTVGVETEI